MFKNIKSYSSLFRTILYERDIYHTSAERIIIPDATNAVNYMFNRFMNVVKNLTVNKENMEKNIDATNGVIFSQRVLLSLVEKGVSREEAYSIVQPLAMKAWEEEIHFKQLLEKNNRVQELLSKDDIDSCFDKTYHLKNVDFVFERLGLS